MNSHEAKQILLLYRPGTADADDPAIAEAIDLARHDPELQGWFDNHCAFQTALRAKFRQVPVPAQLKQTILAQRKVIPLQPWWQRPSVWAAAAAVMVLGVWLAANWNHPRTPDRFADFRARMIRTALREYRMDVVTNNMGQVRQFLAKRGAPADYVVPKGMAQLSLTGGGLLRWRSNPVSMVCFDRGDQQMLYLFVMNRNAVKDPPPPDPQVARVNKLITASWSTKDRTYVLAGPDDPDFTRKFL